MARAGCRNPYGRPTAPWPIPTAGLWSWGSKKRHDGRLVVHGLHAVDKIERDLWNMLANPEKVSCNLLDRGSVSGTNRRQNRTGAAHPPGRPAAAPVFINNNPLRRTFVRTHEGDRRASEDTVRRMLSDAGEQPRDGEILEHFGLDDLEADSLAAYRNLFAATIPNHPFLAGDDRDMLRQLGGWALDRARQRKG